MFGDTPIVDHSFVPSVDSSSTRVIADLEADPSHRRDLEDRPVPNSPGVCDVNLHAEELPGALEGGDHVFFGVPHLEIDRPARDAAETVAGRAEDVEAAGQEEVPDGLDQPRFLVEQAHQSDRRLLVRFGVRQSERDRVGQRLPGCFDDVR